jgi:DNA-binding NarL/FixJ family response regulator
MSESTFAIIDTEPVAIEGLRCLLAAERGLRVIAAESCLAAGIEAAHDLLPDVVVLDKAFGLQSVLEALRELRLRETGVRAVIWGASISDADGLRLLHAGAAGIVRKTASLEMLLDCFTTVASGANWMENGISRAGGAAPSGRLPLTARELQIVELVERGMTNRDIGRELGISTGTVKVHLKHIFEKTGVRGRYGLALSGLKEKGVLLAQEAVM